MLSGLLPDSQISASSMRDIHGSMGAARLVASRSGWFPNPTQPIAGEEWLQVSHFMSYLVFNITLRNKQHMFSTSGCLFAITKQTTVADDDRGQVKFLNLSCVKKCVILLKQRLREQTLNNNHHSLQHLQWLQLLQEQIHWKLRAEEPSSERHSCHIRQGVWYLWCRK